MHPHAAPTLHPSFPTPIDRGLGADRSCSARDSFHPNRSLIHAGGAQTTRKAAISSSLSRVDLVFPILHHSAKMKAPSTAALLVLAGICSDVTLCFAQAQQKPLQDKKLYKEACPAYDQYARFVQ